MAKSSISEQYMQEKFQIMHFLDSARWQKSKAKFYPNFAYPNKNNPKPLSFDEKLLTHWLLYITDRQMSFRQIWDKGGFVFSEIARTFMANKTIDHLTDFATNFTEDGNDGYRFQSKIDYRQVSGKQQKRLARYYTNNELQSLGKIFFKSRFYTDDYVCMLHTLYALQGYDGSLTKYLAKVLKQVEQMRLTQQEDAVKYAVLGMAYALHRLTYEVSFKVDNKRITYKQTDAEKINIEEYVRQYFYGTSHATSHATSLQKDIFSNSTDFQKTLYKFFKSGEKFNSMKRVWCALRDYLKDPAYCDDFKAELQKCGVDQTLLDALFDEADNHQNACQWIELPGDVWNENSEFRRCITKDTKGRLGKLLRKEYKPSMDGYPEEFDTTFDFVPRMCEQGHCDICPFAAIKGQGVDVQKIDALCVDDTNKYCPLVLHYCGYYYKCKGRNACDLWSILNK